jgi:hypothetical protein
MITLGSSTLSAVRFTDFISSLLPIPAMNRWATFIRPLLRTPMQKKANNAIALSQTFLFNAAPVEVLKG